MTARPPKPWDDIGTWLAGAIARRPEVWCGIAIVLPCVLISAGGGFALPPAGVCGVFAVP